ncbi:MAG: hypothetical protein QOI71_332 [Gaiellales bacterium]|jgi:hypothetical protein|nr:hypothetical protein [Gaiellales bacterium]
MQVLWHYGQAVVVDGRMILMERRSPNQPGACEQDARRTTGASDAIATRTSGAMSDLELGLDRFGDGLPCARASLGR